MNLKKKYGNYELHPQMKITGYENEIWDEKKEIIEELKRAVQEKQKEKKTCILSFDLYPGVRKEEIMELANALQPDRIFDIEDCAKDEETLLREFNDYITDDRVFGIMCHKTIDTWFESEKLETMKKAIETECAEEKDTNGGLIVISRSFFADSSYMLSFSVLCSCVCSRLISPSVSSWHKQDNTLMHQSPGHIQRRTPYNF